MASKRKKWILVAVALLGVILLIAADRCVRATSLRARPAMTIRLGMTGDQLRSLIAAGVPMSRQKATAGVDLSDIVALSQPQVKWTKEETSDGTTYLWPDDYWAARLPGVWLGMPDGTCLHLLFEDKRLTLIEVGERGAGYRSPEHWASQKVLRPGELDLAEYRGDLSEQPPVIRAGMKWSEAKFHLSRARPIALPYWYCAVWSSVGGVEGGCDVYDTFAGILPGNTAIVVRAVCHFTTGEREFAVRSIMLGEAGQGFWGKELPGDKK